MQLYGLRIQPGNSKGAGNNQPIKKTHTESVRDPRASGYYLTAEEELLLPLIHSESILPQQAEGVKNSRVVEKPTE